MKLKVWNMGKLPVLVLSILVIQFSYGTVRKRTDRCFLVLVDNSQIG